MARLRIAHLSDLHLGPLPRPAVRALLSKRFFGYANWVRNRGRALSASILHDLVLDLKAHKPDHICLTGDLINIALPAEFDAAAEFLKGLGSPHDVSCTLGNHDAYVPGAAARAAEAWAPYMSGDDGRQRFPYLRRREGVALIGVSTAVATPPLSARGRVGPTQRDALAALLDRNDDAYKVVMIHHPPDGALASGRRALADHKEVRAILAEGCADLVLHGHNHTATLTTLETPRGEVPVIGVPSASSDGSKHPMAGYGLIDIDLATREAKLIRRALKEPGGEMVTVSTVALGVRRDSAELWSPGVRRGHVDR